MQSKHSTFLLLIIFISINNLAFSQLKFARLFSDHAVLQRNEPIPVWGFASPNQQVTVSLNNTQQSAITNAQGKWSVSIPSQNAGGPFVLKASTDTENIEIKDILVGEVYLLSGQSNMAWTVSQADNFAKEKAEANFPQIRHFKVANEVSLEPYLDLTLGSWVVSNSNTVGNFSAVGYFFAKEMYQKYKVPIGLINSSWGGSQVEGWISKEGMLNSKIFNKYAQTIPKNWIESDLKTDRDLRKLVFGSSDYNPNLAEENQYITANYEPKGWASNQIPNNSWDWKGFYGFRGQGYALRNFEMNEDQINQKNILNLPPQESRNLIYINGKLLSDSTIKGYRKFEIPRSFLKIGNNRLAIKCGINKSPDWFGNGMNGKASDLFISSGNESIDLSDKWYLRTSFAEKHEYSKQANMVGTSIYNGMIAPVLPYSIEAVLWYQGESNANRAFQYRESFPLLINDWRRLWGKEIPFYWVQLSSFGRNQNSNEGSNWAELREAQTMTLSLPKTAMVITTDVGNANDIHPTNKQTVGKRMALVAMKNLKNEAVVAEGPSFKSVKYKKGKAIVSFNNVGSGLMVNEKYGYLMGFEVAGKDKVFEYAKATIKGNDVILEAKSKYKIKAVRYAWADSPVDANLFNKEGLPANGFRTDQWNTKTINAKYGE